MVLVRKSWVIWWSVLAQGFHAFAVGRWPGLPSSEALMEQKDWPPWLLPHVVDKLMLILSCWQAGRRFHSSSIRTLQKTSWVSSWHGIWLPLEQNIQEGARQETTGLLWYILRSHTLSFSQYPIDFYGSEPLSIPVHNGRIIQEQDYQEVRKIGAILEAILDAGYYVLLCQLRIPFPLHLTSSHIFQYPTGMSRTLWSLPQIIHHFLLCVYIELCSISINHLAF